MFKLFIFNLNAKFIKLYMDIASQDVLHAFTQSSTFEFYKIEMWPILDTSPWIIQIKHVENLYSVSKRYNPLSVWSHIFTIPTLDIIIAFWLHLKAKNFYLLESQFSQIQTAEELNKNTYSTTSICTIFRRIIVKNVAIKKQDSYVQL